MKINNSIQIFVTGGTFDKSYDYINGDLYFEKTHIPEMLKRSRCRLNVKVKTLMMIDSLEMTQSDIDNIISNCKKCNSKRIVITHGTDRIVKSAKEIQKANIKNKTIILTGAMIPYAFGSSSDGFFNLGCALSFSQSLDNGVYITMQGQYFNPNDVIKNSKKGFFENLI
ncbi:MAG: asparaginase [Flavobacteriaceae bacterium]|nr:asparaginase [Flavobacteriaceae bacterium]